MHFEVSKLRDPEIRNTFKLVLQNKFEALQQLMEEKELSVDDEWRQIEQGYVETCDKVLGRTKANSKEWISEKTWDTIEKLNEVKTNAMSTRHHELNRKVKRGCRRDKRAYVESEAERVLEAGKRGDVRTL